MLNPTLLSRISVDIYMGHCCFEGFKVLASNYWGPLMSMMMSHTHTVYPDIKRLIDGQVITPAQITEELMKSEDVCHIPGLWPIFNDKVCNDLIHFDKILGFSLSSSIKRRQPLRFSPVTKKLSEALPD